LPTVTYLTTGLELGGAERQLTQLACGFARRGWRVQVVSMLPADSPLVIQLKEAGVTAASLGMSPGIPNPLIVRTLAQILQSFGTHVLHSHMVKANLLGRLAANAAGVNVQISTAHNTVEGGWWVKWAYRLTDSMADLTTNVSEKSVARYVDIGAVPAGRIRLVRNGLDLGPFDADPASRSTYRKDLGLDDRFAWIAVGRLTKQKDYLNMIQAFADLSKAHPEASLLIVGKGPERAHIEHQVQELGLTSRVQLLGERADVPSLLNASDAYVMSSAWEGAPIVLLEAAASRLPIAATDVGGNRELVNDGETGLIVPPQNPVALREAMMRIMTASTEKRAEMGRAGRRRTETEFGLDRILDQWEAIYFDLLRQKGVET
jgi:glycosyltransferase involved in cell wall biosynthesis